MNIREQTYNFLWHTGHVWRRGDQWEQNKRGQRQAAKDKMDIVSYIQRSLHLKGCWEADKLMLSSIILNPNDVEQRCYIMLSIEFSLTKSKIVNVVLLYPSLAYYLTYSRYKIVFNHVWLFATPWTVAHQAPLSVGFFRQEYWSRLPFPPRGDLPDPGIEPSSPKSPALQVDSLPLSYWGTPSVCQRYTQIIWW